MIDPNKLQSILQTSYSEVTRNGGFIDFITTVREGQISTIKRHHIDAMFSNICWKKFSAGGHTKLQHRLLGTVIGYQAHTNGITAKIAYDLMKELQNVVNTLGNDVFKYTTQNWKTLPNFNQSVQRAQSMFSQL